MNILGKSALITALALSGVAHASGAIYVTEPGADGFNNQTAAFNGSSYEITQLIFDFSSTLTSDGSHIVIDGAPSAITAPTGGSATFFGGDAVFGFNFTSFNTFDSFSFRWDPDSALNESYDATSLDFVGAKITAVTTMGTYFGVFEQVGATPDVAACLTPVPEPETYALALAGLGVAGLTARRRKSV